MAKRFLNGIDELGSDSELLGKDRLALFTSASSLNRDFESAEFVLHRNYPLRRLFIGEGGVRGEALPGQVVKSGTDLLTSLPMVSLYDYNHPDVPETCLEDVETLVIDIQDMGTRNYSVVPHLKLLIGLAAKQEKRIVVLDRPNPLSGLVYETIATQSDWSDRVPCLDVPLRHGLTVGELCTLFNAELAQPADLKVVPLPRWTRDLLYSDLNRPWIPPLPTIPSFTAAMLYPGTSLLAGTNVSYGMGTPSPYEIIGAPYLDALQFSSRLNKLLLPGVIFRPVYFKPSFGRHLGRHCQGVQIHIVEPHSLRPVELALRILDVLRSEATGDFYFLPPEETGTERHLIDTLVGSSWVRDPNMSYRDLLIDGRQQAEAFKERSQPYLIYPDAVVE